jgi:flavin-dependent dehydrogenase
VTDYFNELLGPLAKSTVINEIHRYELFTDGRVATISLRQPDIIAERNKLIIKLAEKAEAEGAQIVTGTRFLGLRPNGKRLTFSVSINGNTQPVEESASVLVGADGTFSKVARAAAFPTHPTLSLIQAVVDLPSDLPSDTTRIWFVPEETPYFFWLIPQSPTQGVLGVIGDEEHDTLRSLERFLERKALSPIQFQNARIPKYTRWIPNHRKIGAGDVYLVGDAAGHVKVSTVGGVVTGLRAALGTAEAILNGGSSRELQALRRELNRHRLLRKVLNRFTETDYARLIDLLTPSTKRVLSAITRDETKKLLLGLILRQPRLLLLALRTFLIGGSFLGRDKV